MGRRVFHGLMQGAKITAPVGLILVALTTFVLARQKQAVRPFQIKLLPGYHLKQTAGVDTRTGEISKPGGLLIRYDMGGDLPTTEERKTKPVQEWNRQCTWKKDGYPDPKTGTSDVVCWIDADQDNHRKILHVSFPDLTEFWVQIKNDRQVQEALKMVLTYDSRAESTQHPSSPLEKQKSQS